jgi:hypothetical protein
VAVLSRVLIVVDGDGQPKLCFSQTFSDGPAFAEAYELLKQGAPGHFELVPTPQSAIDRFDLPGEE